MQLATLKYSRSEFRPVDACGSLRQTRGGSAFRSDFEFPETRQEISLRNVTLPCAPTPLLNAQEPRDVVSSELAILFDSFSAAVLLVEYFCERFLPPFCPCSLAIRLL